MQNATCQKRLIIYLCDSRKVFNLIFLVYPATKRIKFNKQKQKSK